jgi:hypothetical protein
MSLNIRPPDPNQAKVFDIANPDRVGVIVEAGAEVSEVRFLDDGAVRNIANDHLRTVESTEVELDNPVPSAEPPVHAAVRQGQEAWQRLRSCSTWHDWKRVGAALVIGRAEAMRDGHVNKSKGRSYNAAINAFLKKFGFDDLDSGDRSRLLDVMDHQSGIETWLGKLPPKERLRLNHPTSVWRRWKATTAGPKDPKISRQHKDELAAIIEERDRYKREVEHGGGDLWTPEDRPRDIARIIVGKLSKSKAEKVAREILAALKEANITSQQGGGHDS